MVFALQRKKQNINGRIIFFREHKKAENTKRSGASTDDVYIPKWQHYECLAYMRDAVRPRTSQDSLSLPLVSDSLHMSVCNLPLNPCLFFLNLSFLLYLTASFLFHHLWSSARAGRQKDPKRIKTTV